MDEWKECVVSIRDSIDASCRSGKRGLFPLCSEVDARDRYTVPTLMNAVRDNIRIPIMTPYTGMNPSVLYDCKCLSVEHLVPTSVFQEGRSSNAAFDAFNLMLETRSMNALRGNMPLGDVSEEDANVFVQRTRMRTTLDTLPEYSMLKRGDVTGGPAVTRLFIDPSARRIGDGYTCAQACRLQPLRATRGAIARCVLFIYTAYITPHWGDDSVLHPSAKHWADVAKTMARWDAENPVSDWETQLHDVMARFNGYANVFVMWRAMYPDKPSLGAIMFQQAPPRLDDIRMFVSGLRLTVRAAIRTLPPPPTPRKRRPRRRKKETPPPPPTPRKRIPRRRKKETVSVVDVEPAPEPKPVVDVDPPKAKAMCVIM